MKRFKNLYESVCSFENLLLAANKARRGKRFDPAPLRFFHRLEDELLCLRRELLERTYAPGPYHGFMIRDTKPRLISAAPFRDRVVHHALCNVVEPPYERSFIFDSYACRAGKGTHAAVDRLTAFMRGADYFFKGDVRLYFASIDHAILKGLLRRKIGCAPTLWLMDAIIDGSNPQQEVADWFPGDNLFTPLERRRGLPLGNQTSQFFANVYLDALDHFVKETLGCPRYIRYVDDFIVLGDDKATLHEIRRAVGEFLGTTLRLRLHPRKQFVAPVTLGVDFLGYFVFPTHRRLRPASGHRFARRLRGMAKGFAEGRLALSVVRRRVAAWLGHARHADTYGLRLRLFRDAPFARPGGGNDRLSRERAESPRVARRLLEQQRRGQLPLRKS